MLGISDPVMLALIRAWYPPIPQAEPRRLVRDARWLRVRRARP